MPITPPVWFNYDPDTGIGDPSTPLDASGLTSIMGAYNDRIEEAVDAKLDVTTAATTYATVGDLDGVTFDPVFTGPAALNQTALPLGGSPRTGSILAGAASVQINPAGAYEAFPGLCLCPDGSLLVTWRSASAHGWAPGSATKAARSTDFGQTWSAPWTIYTDPAQDIGFGMLTVLSDGRIACIGQYRSAAPATGSLCVVMFSSDNGTTWTTPTVVPFTFTDYTYAAGNIVEVAGGTLVAIGYGKNTADTYTSTRAILSVDGGASWTGEVTIANGPTLSIPFNEAVVGTLPNGQIMALIRSEEATKKIYRSVSADGGATWSAPTALFEGWGRPAWVPLSSGGLVMTYRGNADLSHLYRTSWDNGATWTSAKQMAGTTPGQSVYTQLVELAPGLVAAAYSDDTSTLLANTRFKYLMDGVGTTPLGDTRKARTERVRVTARDLEGISTPATVSVTGTHYRSWTFSATATNAVSGYVSIPEDWNTFDISVLWAPDTTNAGVCRWDYSYLWIDAAVALGSGTYVAGGSHAANGAANVSQRSTIGNLTVGGPMVGFRIVRAGADAADTFTGQSVLLAVEFTRTS